MKEKIIIDKILNIEIDINKYNNEFQSLNHLKHGLIALYNNVKGFESTIISQNPRELIFFDLDGLGIVPPEVFNLLPSLFHWFGISICNYSRLVGYVISREQGLIGEKDLYPKPDTKKIKLHCDNYFNSLEEIKQIIKWRNKVAAHFALTDPRNEDNIATMEASIIYPVGFQNNRFKTGTMVIGRSDGKDIYESEIPQWSLTESFEIISKRFWPEMVFTN